MNNKVYIGQSIDIKTRWYNHKNELNGKRHCNTYLQNSWNLHGEDNFIFEVIEECKKEDLSQREIYWINFYNSTDKNYGYNLTTGGEGGTGHILTDEQKYNLYLHHKDESDEIIQLSLNGDYIGRWRSAAYASRELNIPVSGIRNCVLENGDQYLCHGYIWVLAEKYDNGLFDYDEYKRKYLEYYLEPISQFDLYGNLVGHWENRVAFSKEHPELNRVIKQCLELKTRQNNGFIYIYDRDTGIITDDYLRGCRVKSQRYKIKQFDLDYNLIHIYTLDEINKLPYRTKTILKCCSNRYAHTKNGLEKAFGYIWEYD